MPEPREPAPPAEPKCSHGVLMLYRCHACEEAVLRRQPQPAAVRGPIPGTMEWAVARLHEAARDLAALREENAALAAALEKAEQGFMDYHEAVDMVMRQFMEQTAMKARVDDATSALLHKAAMAIRPVREALARRGGAR